jgi:hypothetical protein
MYGVAAGIQAKVKTWSLDAADNLTSQRANGLINTSSFLPFSTTVVRASECGTLRF